MIRALMLCHGFPPTRHSGVFRSDAFARYLPEFGVEPAVVAATEGAGAIPQYPRDATDDAAGVRVHRIDWEIDDGCRSRVADRVPALGTLARRARNARRRRRLAEAIAPIVERESPSVVWATGPPFQALTLGGEVARRAGLPYVCDLRDPWLCYPGRAYRHVFDFAIERAFVRRTLEGAARVVVTNETLRQRKIELFRLDPERVACIPNGFDSREFEELPPSGLDAETFNVVYAGLLNAPAKPRVRSAAKRLLGLDYLPVDDDWSTRSPAAFLDAAALVGKRTPDFLRDLRLHIAGPVEPGLRSWLEAHPLSANVVLHGAVSQKAANALCVEADLLLLLQVAMRASGKDACTVVPGKLYNYLRSGTPILAAMQESDGTALVREFRAGDCVPPRDVEAIAGILRERHSAWKSGGRALRKERPAGIERLDRREGARALAELLRAAAERSPA